jgi:lipoprotein
MRRNLFMLLSLLALSACGKEDVQEYHNQQGEEIQINISAHLSADDAPKAMDYKLINNKVQKDLEGKSKVYVYTCIYEGNKKLFAENIQWDVTAEKKLKYNGSVSLSAQPTNPSQLRLLAVIGEVIGSRQPNNIVLASSYPESGTVGVLSSDAATTINVPYIMEVKLGKDISGLWVPKGQSQIFKPYGHLVRFKIKNGTASEVTITGVSSNKFLAGKSTLNAEAKTLEREEYGTHLDLNLSREVKIASGMTSTETFVLWVPKMATKGSYSLDLRAKGIEDSRIYTTMEIEKNQGDYKNGKLYNATLTLHKTCIPNPLSLLSEDVMNKEGSDFVDLRNTFKMDDLSTYNGPGKVGYFQYTDAIDKFSEEKTYPSTGNILWHQPDPFEWNSLLYNPRNKQPGATDFQDRTEKVQVKVGVGNNASIKSTNSYWKTISYSVHVPEESKGTYNSHLGDTRPTIKTGKSFYILSFAAADAPLPDAKNRFPRETTNVNRYAFRYTLYNDHFRVDCAPVGIQDIQANQLPGHRIFSGIGVVSRKLPFYGISAVPPYTTKDLTGDNIRIIDYVTNTKYEKGDIVIAAFSGPANGVLTYPFNYGFPVALFKKW